MEKSAIEKIPEIKGVYELAASDIVLYIGQSDNLRRRLLEHLNSLDKCIQRATQFCYQQNQDSEKLEQTLLQNYKQKYGGLPTCNEQAK